MVAGTGRPAAESRVGAKSTWLTSSDTCMPRLKPGPSTINGMWMELVSHVGSDRHGKARGGKQGGREIHVAHQLGHLHAAIEAGAFDNQRDVDGAGEPRGF